MLQQLAGQDAFGRKLPLIGVSAGELVALAERWDQYLNQLDDFATAFNACSVLVLTDIYAASEPPIEGVTTEVLAEAIRAHGHQEVIHVPDLQEVASFLRDVVQPGDLVLTLGAGTIWQTSEELMVYLKGASGVG